MVEDRTSFDVEVGPLFEGAPRFLDRLAAERPFATSADMFERARAIAHTMPEAEQLELIDAHPRLGAPMDAMSASSRREQGDATTNLATELERLNAAYEARFGFRYCVFVAGRSRAELIPDMARAIGAERRAEIERALDAVVDIAADRYRRAVEAHDSAEALESSASAGDAGR